MHCVICKQGKFRPGTTTVTLSRGDTILVIKDVPAEVCDNCGEPCLHEVVTERLLGEGEEATGRSVEMEVLRYATINIPFLT